MCDQSSDPKIFVTATIVLMSDGRYSLELLSYIPARFDLKPLRSTYANLSLPEALQIIDVTTAQEFTDPF
jgi:hypothetical protein